MGPGASPPWIPRDRSVLQSRTLSVTVECDSEQ